MELKDVKSIYFLGAGGIGMSALVRYFLAEGKAVAEMTDSIQKLYDLWTDALADAGTAYSTLANINLDTESVAPMLSTFSRRA